MRLLFIVLVAVIFTGCATKDPYPELSSAEGNSKHSTRYRIAPGDSLNIFVWRNPDVSTSVPVRPDGYLSAPLLEDVLAAGKTPTELARDIEKALSTYIRDPLVTVIVDGFVGNYNDQIRVVGEATDPKALLYRDDMTLLDVMIGVGGLTEFADGDKAVVVRREEGGLKQYRVKIRSLLKEGDISANVDMQPGDVVIIPESWF